MGSNWMGKCNTIGCTRQMQRRVGDYYFCEPHAAEQDQMCEALSGGTGNSVPRWRVGKKLGRTLYLDGECVGMVDTAALAAEMVAVLNGKIAPR